MWLVFELHYYADIVCMYYHVSWQPYNGKSFKYSNTRFVKLRNEQNANVESKQVRNANAHIFMRLQNRSTM